MDLPASRRRGVQRAVNAHGNLNPDKGMVLQIGTPPTVKEAFVLLHQVPKKVPGTFQNREKRADKMATMTQPEHVARGFGGFFGIEWRCMPGAMQKTLASENSGLHEVQKASEVAASCVDSKQDL